MIQIDKSTLPSDVLIVANIIRRFEQSMNPKLPVFHYEGRAVMLGHDLSPETMDALRSGEIITVLNQCGSPEFHLAMDGYGQLREHRV